MRDRTHQGGVEGRAGLLAALGLCLVPAAFASESDRQSVGVELAVLGAENWDELAPAGKEVDAIYGDIVLRNAEIVAVVAFPRSDRDGNLSTRSVGGALLDLTRRHPSNDQLTAFFPGGGEDLLGLAGVEVDGGARVAVTDPAELAAGGERISLVLETAAAANPSVEVRYTLAAGAPYLEVESRFVNRGTRGAEVALRDVVRIDQSSDGMAIDRSADGPTRLFEAYDSWFGQAYGVMAEGEAMLAVTTQRAWMLPVELDYPRAGRRRVEIPSGETLVLRRFVFPGVDLLAVRRIAARLAGRPTVEHVVEVRDGSGPVHGAEVHVTLAGEALGWGRTGADGRVEVALPATRSGPAVARITALGRGEARVPVDPAGETTTVTLDDPAWIATRVRDGDAGAIPAKIQIFGRFGTEAPFFGPDSGDWGVHNVLYSHDGQMLAPVVPGSYDVIVSHGNEYDAAFLQLDVRRGSQAIVDVTLDRPVDTSGWVSADFHSHASPSGDNTSSQLGRVLNLLAEHIEFAPCTEHQRISSYAPHLERLGAAELMATCSGIELTSTPSELNHHNAFPLVHHEHTQDGGGPRFSLDPELQIARLALWDGASDKLVQQNHPDMSQLFFDRDRDGVRDEGFRDMFGFMDVIEVHPPGAVLWAPFTDRPRPRSAGGPDAANRLHGWMQILNQGFRIPGVVNTDAHDNFHGSGWLRNYVRSSRDEPGEIDVMEMVHAAEAGHVVMTNGPFLEVTARAAGDGGAASAIPGDDLVAPGGDVLLRVRVQCANWLDVDRVFVLVNGRVSPELDFRRASHGERFGDGVVKFEQEIEISLAADAHLVVAAVGESLHLGPVVGPHHALDRPVALANPIFVDVDGGGFRANGDELDRPLTVTPLH